MEERLVWFVINLEIVKQTVTLQGNHQLNQQHYKHLTYLVSICFSFYET